MMGSRFYDRRMYTMYDGNFEVHTAGRLKNVAEQE